MAARCTSSQTTNNTGYNIQRVRRGGRAPVSHLVFHYRIILYICAKALNLKTDPSFMFREVSKDADLARSVLCRFLSGWNSFIE
jgi:hypothetical protein